MWSETDGEMDLGKVVDEVFVWEGKVQGFKNPWLRWGAPSGVCVQ
jgi:hypothetical protein